MPQNWSKDYPESKNIDIESLGDNHSLVKMLNFIGENMGGRNATVVDFGCATGYFPALLKQYGYSVIGVEINPDAAKVAEAFCEKVIVADLDITSIEEIFPAEKFDIVTFGDVLEHLRDPWRVLKEVREILKPNGFVVASIPNIAHGDIRLALLQGNFDYTPLGILDNTHLRFFTKKTVESLFEETGYLIDSEDVTHLPLFSGSNLVPRLDSDLVASPLAEKLRQDANAETLQFIIKAVPATLEARHRALADKHSKLINDYSLLEKTSEELNQKWFEERGQLNTQVERLVSQLNSIQCSLENETVLRQQQQQLLKATEEATEQLKEQLGKSRSEITELGCLFAKEQKNCESLREAITSQNSREQEIQTHLNTVEKDFLQNQHQLALAKLDINGMESSKFWRLRAEWFKIRRLLGMRDETQSFIPKISATFPKLLRAYQAWRERGTRGFIQMIVHRKKEQKTLSTNYSDWIEKNSMGAAGAIIAKEEMKSWITHPKFSIIMPVYNVDRRWLERAIQSVLNQVYEEWELCIADDKSSSPEVEKVLKRYAELDPRIKIIFREENGNISAASNSALEISSGDYIALLDNDDELSIDALYENAKLINRHPNADFIYSDEDKISAEGNRCDPFFKPDWSPDYFHACMYTCHLGVYRAHLIKKIGGFRSEFDGSQDYDLVLRVSEETNAIYHISKILYHWRVLPSSVTSGEQAKPWAYAAARRALESMLERNKHPGYVETGASAGFWRVRREIQQSPLISLIIPSAGTTKETEKGNICLLENCIESIIQLTTYPRIEIVVVDGFDISEKTLNLLHKHQVKVAQCSKPFNFSERVNIGVRVSNGDFLVLLNDDTEVITPDWIESMLELAQQEKVGAVGAKLLYQDRKIQHAGVLILGGNPTHAFHGAEENNPGYYYSNCVNRNYLAVTAACLMVSRELFEKLDGFDESFPLNYNDVDFCLRLHESGYRQVFTPYAQLIHYESASRAEGLKPGEWENLHSKWSHYLNDLHDDPYYNPNLSKDRPNFELSV